MSIVAPCKVQMEGDGLPCSQQECGHRHQKLVFVPIPTHIPIPDPFPIPIPDLVPISVSVSPSLSPFLIHSPSLSLSLTPFLPSYPHPCPHPRMAPAGDIAQPGSEECPKLPTQSTALLKFRKLKCTLFKKKETGRTIYTFAQCKYKEQCNLHFFFFIFIFKSPRSHHSWIDCFCVSPFRRLTRISCQPNFSFILFQVLI